MINVFGIAHRAVGVVNPPVAATLKASNGSTVNPDGSMSPAFIEIAIEIKVQALSTSDIQRIGNVSQQSDMRAVYMPGGIKALNRPLQFGGDILNFYGSDWKVTQGLEEWGEGQWSKVAVTRQQPSSQAQPNPNC